MFDTITETPKKRKERLDREFLEKHKNTVIIVNGCNWSMTLDEIEEQESWRRKPEENPGHRDF